ncbi:MAG: PKD domain-containing protein, partial [Acidobacteriaceae bacterium]
HYTWSFGDGTSAIGRKVKHRFPDAQGTLLDGSGLYRVLLHVSNDSGRNTWIYIPTVVRDSQTPALPETVGAPGVLYRLKTERGMLVRTGTSPTLSLDDVHPPKTNYSVEFSTDVDVPEDGGYVFTVVANDSSSIAIDGKTLGNGPAPFAQVCGLAGNAARSLTAAVELSRGLHHLDVTESHSKGIDDFRVLWQRPGKPIEPVPVDLLSHH